jgi:hypothetical protein
MRGQKVDKSQSMLLLDKVKVHSVTKRLNINTIKISKKCANEFRSEARCRRLGVKKKTRLEEGTS